MRRAQDRKGVDLSAIHEFSKNEAGFNGLADTHVIRDQEAGQVDSKRHEQRHELIGPGLKSELRGGAEGPSTTSKRQTERVGEKSGFRLDGEGRIVGEVEASVLDGFCL